MKKQNKLTVFEIRPKYKRPITVTVELGNKVKFCRRCNNPIEFTPPKQRNRHRKGQRTECLRCNITLKIRGNNLIQSTPRT
jgi:predicted SprT family Zn-dependent metalloprotease